MSDMLVQIGDARTELHLRLMDLLRAEGTTEGGIVPGELELAQRLEVGRPQVREALSVLEGFGAVRSRQGARRIWVGFNPEAFGRQLGLALGPTPRAVAELLEVRQGLETSLLPRAIDRLKPEALATLRGIADAMVELANAGKSFSVIDGQFHRVLLGSLGNEVLDGLLAAFWSVFGTYTEQNPPAEDQLPVALMHGRILDAIELGDVRLAIHELDAHFYGVRQRLSPARSESDPDAAPFVS